MIASFENDLFLFYVPNGYTTFLRNEIHDFKDTNARSILFFIF